MHERCRRPLSSLVKGGVDSVSSPRFILHKIRNSESQRSSRLTDSGFITGVEDQVMHYFVTSETAAVRFSMISCLFRERLSRAPPASTYSTSALYMYASRSRWSSIKRQLAHCSTQPPVLQILAGGSGGNIWMECHFFADLKWGGSSRYLRMREHF